MKICKKILGISLVVLLLTGCGKKTDDQNKNQPDGENRQVESNASVSDFNFKLLSSTFENGTSNFEFEITNTSNETKHLGEFQVGVKDKDGNILVTLSGVVNADIAANDKTSISCSYGGDLSSFDSLDYSLVD